MKVVVAVVGSFLMLWLALWIFLVATGDEPGDAAVAAGRGVTVIVLLTGCALLGWAVWEWAL